MDWLDYREKLGIGFNDEKKVEYFKIRMFNVLKKLDQAAATCFRHGEYFEFCNMIGICEKSTNWYFDAVLEFLESHSLTMTEFLSYYVAFMNCWRDEEYIEVKRENLKYLLCNQLKESHIHYEIVEDKDGVFFFPKGAKEFDDALISQPLEWLSEYPKTRKTYTIALRQYADGVYIRDVADNLRKALEMFLQEFLGNTKNLETNKNEICKYLGGQAVDSGIAGLFQPLITAYKNINDRIAKHNDCVDKKMLEFLIYQTGILIRMVITVKKSEKVEQE